MAFITVRQIFSKKVIHAKKYFQTKNFYPHNFTIPQPVQQNKQGTYIAAGWFKVSFYKNDAADRNFLFLSRPGVFSFGSIDYEFYGEIEQSDYTSRFVYAKKYIPENRWTFMGIAVLNSLKPILQFKPIIDSSFTYDVDYLNGTSRVAKNPQQNLFLLCSGPCQGVRKLFYIQDLARYYLALEDVPYFSRFSYYQQQGGQMLQQNILLNIDFMSGDSQVIRNYASKYQVLDFSENYQISWVDPFLSEPSIYYPVLCDITIHQLDVENNTCILQNNYIQGINGYVVNFLDLDQSLKDITSMMIIFFFRFDDNMGQQRILQILNSIIEVDVQLDIDDSISFLMGGTYVGTSSILDQGWNQLALVIKNFDGQSFAQTVELYHFDELIGTQNQNGNTPLDLIYDNQISLFNYPNSIEDNGFSGYISHFSLFLNYTDYQEFLMFVNSNNYRSHPKLTYYTSFREIIKNSGESFDEISFRKFQLETNPYQEIPDDSTFCPIGYYVGNQQCQKIPLVGCLYSIDDQMTSCQICDQVKGFKLNLLNRQCQCQSGLFLVNGTCLGCHYSCSTCNGPTNKDCLTLYPGNFTKNAQGNVKCPANQFYQPQQQVCTQSFCGNSLLEKPNETCDDGNNVPGDGCSDYCQVEPAYICVVPGQSCIPQNQIKSAQFIQNYTAIRFDFFFNISLKNQNCDQIFQQAFIYMIGNSAKCSLLSNYKSIIVNISVDNSFQDVFDNFYISMNKLNFNYLEYYYPLIFESSLLNIKVQYNSTDSLVFKPIIVQVQQSLTELTQCNNQLKISVNQTSGLKLFPALIIYQTSSIDLGFTKVLSQNFNQSKLEISFENLTNFGNYSITIIVQNALSSSTRTYVIFNRLQQETNLTLLSPQILEPRRFINYTKVKFDDKIYIFNPIVQLSECAKKYYTLDQVYFSWTDQSLKSYPNDKTISLSTVEQDLLQNKTIQLRLEVMSPTIQVTAIQEKFVFFFNPSEDSIGVNIVGEKYQDIEKNLNLIANPFDYEFQNAKFKYNWTCISLNGLECPPLTYIQNNQQLQINQNSLSNNGIYNFRLKVSNDAQKRSFTTDYQVTMVYKTFLIIQNQDKFYYPNDQNIRFEAQLFYLIGEVSTYNLCITQCDWKLTNPTDIDIKDYTLSEKKNSQLFLSPKFMKSSNQLYTITVTCQTANNLQLSTFKNFQMIQSQPLPIIDIQDNGRQQVIKIKNFDQSNQYNVYFIENSMSQDLTFQAIKSTNSQNITLEGDNSKNNSQTAFLRSTDQYGNIAISSLPLNGKKFNFIVENYCINVSSLLNYLSCYLYSKSNNITDFTFNTTLVGTLLLQQFYDQNYQDNDSVYIIPEWDAVCQFEEARNKSCLQLLQKYYMLQNTSMSRINQNQQNDQTLFNQRVNLCAQKSFLLSDQISNSTKFVKIELIFDSKNSQSNRRRMLSNENLPGKSSSDMVDVVATIDDDEQSVKMFVTSKDSLDNDGQGIRMNGTIRLSQSIDTKSDIIYLTKKLDGDQWVTDTEYGCYTDQVTLEQIKGEDALVDWVCNKLPYGLQIQTVKSKFQLSESKPSLIAQLILLAIILIYTFAQFCQCLCCKKKQPIKDLERKRLLQKQKLEMGIVLWKINFNFVDQVLMEVIWKITKKKFGPIPVRYEDSVYRLITGQNSISYNTLPYAQTEPQQKYQRLGMHTQQSEMQFESGQTKLNETLEGDNKSQKEQNFSSAFDEENKTDNSHQELNSKKTEKKKKTIKWNHTVEDQIAERERRASQAQGKLSNLGSLPGRVFHKRDTKNLSDKSNQIEIKTKQNMFKTFQKGFKKGKKKSAKSSSNKSSCTVDSMNRSFKDMYALNPQQLELQNRKEVEMIQEDTDLDIKQKEALIVVYCIAEDLDELNDSQRHSAISRFWYLFQRFNGLIYFISQAHSSQVEEAEGDYYLWKLIEIWFYYFKWSLYMVLSLYSWKVYLLQDVPLLDMPSPYYHQIALILIISALSFFMRFMIVELKNLIRMRVQNHTVLDWVDELIVKDHQAPRHIDTLHRQMLAGMIKYVNIDKVSTLREFNCCLVFRFLLIMLMSLFYCGLGCYMVFSKDELYDNYEVQKWFVYGLFSYIIYEFLLSPLLKTILIMLAVKFVKECCHTKRGSILFIENLIRVFGIYYY